MPNLLQRPPIMEDEWWSGYVARVLAANGHAPTREYMLAKLEPLVSSIVPVGLRHKAIAGAPTEGGLRSFSKWTFPSWAVRGENGAAAHCPFCFGDQPYMRLSWRLRAVTHCALHNCPLQTRCSACSVPLFQWDLARRTCRCGMAIGKSSARLAESSQVGSAYDCSDARSNWLFSAQVANAAMASHEVANRSSDCPKLGLLIFLGELLPALATVHHCGLDKKTNTVAEFLARLNLVLTECDSLPWVERLISALPSVTHLRAALTVVLKLYSQEQSKQSALHSLPLLHWAQMLCDLGASSAKAEGEGLIEPGLLSAGLVSLKQAARQAGITSMHLHELMKKGVVTPTRTFDVGGRHHFFSQEQIQSLSRFHHQAYAYGNSLDLGFEGNGIFILRNSKVVPIVEGNDGRKWLDGNKLRDLLKRLGEISVPSIQINACMVSLGSKRILQSRYAPALKALFERLCSGEISLWSCGEAPGFARFYIGLDGLDFLHRGAVGCAQSLDSSDRQQSIPLTDVEMTWKPTPPPWHRPPMLGRPRPAPCTCSQLTLHFA